MKLFFKYIFLFFVIFQIFKIYAQQRNNLLMVRREIEKLENELKVNVEKEKTLVDRVT